MDIFGRNSGEFDDEDDIKVLLMKEMTGSGHGFIDEVSDESIFGSEKVEDLLEKR